LRWSELEYKRKDFYVPFDENQRAIRGFWLTTQGIDLENLPAIFNEPFKYIKNVERNGTQTNEYEERKVYLNDIVGTSYDIYGDIDIIECYIKIKRACYYIKDGRVTKNKYFRMLKRQIYTQKLPVLLSINDDGTYYVDGNGNHRVIFYKMMMLSEISLKYPDECSRNYGVNYVGFSDICKKYWLYAKVQV